MHTWRKWHIFVGGGRGKGLSTRLRKMKEKMFWSDWQLAPSRKHSKCSICRMIETSLTIETSRHWFHILKEVGFALDQSKIYKLLLNEYKSGNKTKNYQKLVALCNSYPMFVVSLTQVYRVSRPLFQVSWSQIRRGKPMCDQRWLVRDGKLA